jgi:cation diffusion facilitator CzcD-associated flavoprotein CzcO
MGFYQFTRRYPDRANRWVISTALRQLRDLPDAERHFTPSYNVWDQRLCLAPDGDLFAALRAGTASIVTDHIATFTETGIALASGPHLDADLIVSATGLQLQFFGGVALEVDGRAIDPPATMVYKGSMVSGVPNLAFASGYTNASWTLKCDLCSHYVCRLVNFMDERGYAQARPLEPDPSLPREPFIDFNSGYVVRAIHKFPKQGPHAPWRLYQNYPRDIKLLKRGPLEDEGIVFSRAPTKKRELEPAA